MAGYRAIPRTLVRPSRRHPIPVRPIRRTLGGSADHVNSNIDTEYSDGGRGNQARRPSSAGPLCAGACPAMADGAPICGFDRMPDRVRAGRRLARPFPSRRAPSRDGAQSPFLPPIGVAASRRDGILHGAVHNSSFPRWKFSSHTQVASRQLWWSEGIRVIRSPRKSKNDQHKQKIISR